MNMRIFHKDEVVFHQGDESHTMFEIQNGQIGIYANYQTPKEKQLAVFGQGETFGEMGMIENLPRSATAVALADGTEAEEVGAAEFSDYFEEKPVQVFLLVKQLSHRLRETTKNYEEACRTVSETVEAGQKGEERSRGLKDRLKFFADVYRGFVNGEKAD